MWSASRSSNCGMVAIACVTADAITSASSMRAAPLPFKSLLFTTVTTSWCDPGFSSIDVSSYPVAARIAVLISGTRRGHAGVRALCAGVPNPSARHCLGTCAGGFHGKEGLGVAVIPRRAVRICAYAREPPARHLVRRRGLSPGTHQRGSGPLRRERLALALRGGFHGSRRADSDRLFAAPAAPEAAVASPGYGANG